MPPGEFRLPKGILDELVAVVIEVDGLIVFANALAVQLLGFDRVELLVGKSLEVVTSDPVPEASTNPGLVFARRTLRTQGGSLTQVAEQIVPTTWEGQPARAHLLHPPNPLRQAQPRRATNTPLTRRETQVAKLLADGFTVANIAARLEISENTVRTHVKSVYRKAGTRSRVDLAWMVSDLNAQPEGNPDSQGRLIHLIESGQVPFFVHRNGKMLYVNQACYRLLGFNPNENSLEGLDGFLFVHPSERTDARRNNERTLERIGTHSTLVRRFVDAQGRNLSLLGTIMSIEWQGEPALAGACVPWPTDSDDPSDSHLDAFGELPDEERGHLILFALGFKDRDIAALLRTPVGPVTALRRRLQRKLGARTQSELRRMLSVFYV